MAQQQGEASEHVKVFQKLFAHICGNSTAAHERLTAAVGKDLGFIMSTTMAAKRRSGQRVQQLRKQVQVDDQSTLPSSYRSFVAYGGYDEPYAPHILFGTECDAHRAPISALGRKLLSA